MSAALRQHLSAKLEYQQDEVLLKFAEAIKSEFKDSLVTIIFYGSCRREREYKNALLDFYVIVNSYQKAYKSFWHKLANKLLPPNVFYLQLTIGAQMYRAKYAVISQSDMSYRVSPSAFHGYFWARFTQPLAYIYAGDSAGRDWIIDIQSCAAKTFAAKVTPVLHKDFSSQSFWTRGFELTYAAELRAERKDRGAKLYQHNQAFYDRISACLEAELHHANGRQSCRVNLCLWKLRILYGKCLSVLRLLKASATFANGADYIVWKIQRHGGESVQLSRRQKKYPWLFAWPVIIRLYRRGHFH